MQVWKIAPGKGAEHWELFRDHWCIAIDWLRGASFDSFASEADVLRTLEARHGKGAPGYGTGAAAMIWQFVQEVSRGDLVVANRGYNQVVGVGIVTSDYLPPGALENPLRDDDATLRHHARRVNWIITDPVDIPGDQFFVQWTLQLLQKQAVEQIRAAYHAEHPVLQATIDALFAGEYEDDVPLPEEVPDPAAHWEGAVRKVFVNAYERSGTARQACLEVHGRRCCVCGFDFGATYGPEADGFIHVHHLRPLASIGKGYAVDPVQDLRPVCPNCHAVIHLGGGCKSIEDVQQLLAEQRLSQ